MPDMKVSRAQFAFYILRKFGEIKDNLRYVGGERRVKEGLARRTSTRIEIAAIVINYPSHLIINHNMPLCICSFVFISHTRRLGFIPTTWLFVFSHY